MNCLDTSDYCKTVVKKIKPTLIWEPKCTKLAIKSHFSIPNNNVQVGCKNDAIRTDEMIVDPSKMYDSRATSICTTTTH